jgi:hypothetical protein
LRRGRGHHASGPKHIARSHATAGDDNAFLVDPFDGTVCEHLDAERRQGRRRLPGQAFRKGRQNPRPGLHQHHPRHRRIDCTKLARQPMARQLGDGSGQLDTRRTTADDHKGQHVALHCRRLGILCLLEGEQQAAPNGGRIVDLLQARCERGPFIMPKVAVARASGDDQVVIRYTDIPHDHLTRSDVDSDDAAEQDANIGLIPKEAAYWPGDVSRR